jgi:hypothetical protein
VSAVARVREYQELLAADPLRPPVQLVDDR